MYSDNTKNAFCLKIGILKLQASDKNDQSNEQ